MLVQTWCLPTDLSFCLEPPANTVLSSNSLISPFPYSPSSVRHVLGGTRLSGIWLHLQWRSVLYHLLCPSQFPHQCPCFFLTSIILVLLLCFFFQLCLQYDLYMAKGLLSCPSKFFLIPVLTAATFFLNSYLWRYEDDIDVHVPQRIGLKYYSEEQWIYINNERKGLEIILKSARFQEQKSYN